MKMKQLSMFTPRTERQKKDWLAILTEKFNILDWKKSYRICILHFSEECIEREKTIFLKGGKVEKELRKIPLLTDEADPSIFPSVRPQIKPNVCNILEVSEEQKFQLKNNIDKKGDEKILCDNSNVNNNNIAKKDSNERKCENVIKQGKNDVFSEILQKVKDKKMVSNKLDHMWLANISDNECVSWSIWEPDFSSIAKCIVLYKDLTFKET